MSRQCRTDLLRDPFGVDVALDFDNRPDAIDSGHIQLELAGGGGQHALKPDL